MTAKYIIRLDDACPYLNIDNWYIIEQLLDKYKIKPIVAVIPDCQDESINLNNNPIPHFWELVRKWQNKGWIIGMHGYKHKYIYMRKKTQSIVPIHKRTEFASLPYKVQAEKIKSAYKIFIDEGINPELWVAPAHTFDENTLRALYDLTEIRIISDAFAFNIFKYKKFIFIPQQLWKYVKMPFGLWTICLHPNSMSKKDLISMEGVFKSYYYYFADLKKLTIKERKWSIFEKFLNDYIVYDENKISFFRKIKKLGDYKRFGTRS
jgi:predicted deacetylase